MDYFRMIETQFSKSIKVFRSDNGGEFFSHELETFLWMCSSE